MTRPPDFDLTTVEGIVRTVEAMRRASDGAVGVVVWAASDGVITVAGWAASAANSAAEEYAYNLATEAAHHARRLQGVAELVSVSGDLAAWQEWRERGKA